MRGGEESLSSNCRASSPDSSGERCRSGGGAAQVAGDLREQEVGAARLADELREARVVELLLMAHPGGGRDREDRQARVFRVRQGTDVAGGGVAVPPPRRP